MRRVFCILFSAIALLTLGLDLWRGPIQGRPAEFATLADYWRAIDPSAAPTAESLSAAAPAGLWDQTLSALLTAPVFALALGLALFFYLIRKRRPPVRKGLIFPRKRR